MLDLERIQQLVDMMVANDLTEISLRDGDVEVNLRRPTGNMVEVVPGVGGNSPASNPDAGTSAASSAELAGKEDEEKGKVEEIKSPMVGTFYAQPEPGTEPYVRVGSRIDPGKTLCIIEAMKIMNPLISEVSGVVAEIPVEDAQPIEFGQVLFRVNPNG